MGDVWYRKYNASTFFKERLKTSKRRYRSRQMLNYISHKEHIVGFLWQFIVLYIGYRDFAQYLPVHEFKKEETYYLGVFLVGAYQEILGDLHNLFGDTNAVHIICNDNGGYDIEQIIEGETVEDVLDYVQFSAKKLVRTMESWVSQSVKDKVISLQEGKEFLAIYRSGLYGYTYLEE